jgi:hypothetical protein
MVGQIEPSQSVNDSNRSHKNEGQVIWDWSLCQRVEMNGQSHNPHRIEVMLVNLIYWAVASHLDTQSWIICNPVVFTPTVKHYNHWDCITFQTEDCARGLWILSLMWTFISRLSSKHDSNESSWDNVTLRVIMFFEKRLNELWEECPFTQFLMNSSHSSQKHRCAHDEWPVCSSGESLWWWALPKIRFLDSDLRKTYSPNSRSRWMVTSLNCSDTRVSGVTFIKSQF